MPIKILKTKQLQKESFFKNAKEAIWGNQNKYSY
jgi:hypothetical protein